jgi:hypothetical protein
MVEPGVIVKLPEVTVQEQPVTFPSVKLFPVPPFITIPSEAVGAKALPLQAVPLYVFDGNTVCVVVTTVEHPDAVLVPVTVTVTVAGELKYTDAADVPAT